jgi:hypothetical protein
LLTIFVGAIDTIIAGKCDLPILRDESVIISANTEGPILGGSTISYSCSNGRTLTGFNTSTCMDNGHWEPDPVDTSCTGNHNYYLEYLVWLMYTKCHAYIHMHYMHFVTYSVRVIILL